MTTQTKIPETGERNCVSVVLIWSKDEFKKKRENALVIIRNALGKIKECAENSGNIVFESKSTIEGNQARLDLVFETEKQAKNFNMAVNEIKNNLGKVFFRSFLYSEAEIGYKQDPALTEMNILQLAKDGRVKNIFRHFLTCNVVSEDGQILFKFDSLADTNLFLYNKSNAADMRVTGMIRQNQEPLCLLPDCDGMFSLCVQMKEMQDNEDCWSWRHLEEKFGFHTKHRGQEMYFQFKNKLDLYVYFASEEAKKCASIEIPISLIGNIEEMKIAEEKAIRNELLAVEAALISAKVELANKNKILESQKRIIAELRTEWKMKLGKRQS